METRSTNRVNVFNLFFLFQIDFMKINKKKIYSHNTITDIEKKMKKKEEGGGDNLYIAYLKYSFMGLYSFLYDLLSS